MSLLPALIVSRGNLITLWGGIRTFCLNNWQSKALRFCSFHYPSSKEHTKVLFTPRDKLAFEAEVVSFKRRKTTPSTLTGSSAKLFQLGPYWARITKMWRISGVVVTGNDVLESKKGEKDKFWKHKATSFFFLKIIFLKRWIGQNFLDAKLYLIPSKIPSRTPPVSR